MCYCELSPFLFDIRYAILRKQWEKYSKFLDHVGEVPWFYVVDFYYDQEDISG